MSWSLIHFRMFLRVMQWSNHCVLGQIFLVGVFVWAPAPFVCLVVVSLDETQVWLGDLRVVWLVCVLFGLLGFASISGRIWSLYKLTFYCLCSCKDRATVRHRHTRGKKIKVAAHVVGQAVVCRASSLHLSLLRQKSEKMP